MENSHLKQELQDNSSHLTKLENEASNMKDVLAHLHSAMEHDLDRTLTLEDLIAYSHDNDNLDHNSNNSNGMYNIVYNFILYLTRQDHRPRGFIFTDDEFRGHYST